jgi:hypothetical protein
VVWQNQYFVRKIFRSLKWAFHAIFRKPRNVSLVLTIPHWNVKKRFKRNYSQPILLNNCRNTLCVWYLKCVVSRQIIPWISTWSLHVKWGAFIFLCIVVYPNNASTTSENGKENINMESGNIIWNITTLEGFGMNKRK